MGDWKMTHLSASKLTFSPAWDAMNDEDRTAEQVAAIGIVAACGGETKAQYVLTTDSCLFSVTEYPNEDAALKSALAITRRGAFVLETQRAVPLDAFMGMDEEIRKIAGK